MKFTMFLGRNWKALQALAMGLAVAAPIGLAEGHPKETRHAQELMGPHYKRTLASIAEVHEHVDFRDFIETQVSKSLPKAFKRQSRKVAQTILSVSEKYEFDPVFLMAVIANESSFNPKARGSVGEIGLMQLRPETAKWVHEKLALKGVKSTPQSLEDPVNNIKIGAAYLNMLREKFDSHGRLYLAAYNMGVSNVNRKLKENLWPKEYPIRVMKRYIGFYNSLKDVIREAKEKLIFAASEKEAPRS